MSDWWQRDPPPWERRLERLPEAPEADISEFERYPSYEEPIPLEPEAWFGNEVTLYSSGKTGFQPLPPGGGFTAEDWFDEAVLPGPVVMQRWGLSNLDIIEQLISQGHDYTYIDEEGYERSGLWRDWRDAYAEANE